MSSKSARHRTLLDIVRARRVSTQSDIARRLKRAGFPCTQASVSRDMRELGLVKRAGVYAPPDQTASVPGAEKFGSSIAPFVQSVTAVGRHLLVVRTVTGTANTVALFMDKAGWPGLIGTVAGDDTIIAVVTDAAAGRDVTGQLEAIREA